MARNKFGRKKHVPQRTCVGCREFLPKKTLIRIVKGPEGVDVDLTGKAHGRGAYLHDQRACWERGVKGALDHALRTRLTDEEQQKLMAFFDEHLGKDSQGQKGAEELS